MFDKIPRILSQDPSARGGKSGVKYKYADGSIGFREYASGKLIVTSKKNIITTYWSNGAIMQVEKPDGSVEHYFDNKNNCKRFIKYYDGQVDFKHYDKDGNDDTIKYLAIKKVAQRQAEKGEKLRQEAQEKGKSPEIMVTKKLNKVQKAIAMHKAKKEVSK